MKKKLLILCLVLTAALTGCTLESKVENYSFTKGAHQCLAVVGDELMCASDTSLRVYDVNGEVVFEDTLDMKYPAISESRDNAVVYDIGGTQLRYFDGSGLTNDKVIISADVNDAGYLALCTEADGYKGSVTVYSASKQELYKWLSADNWILKAEVSPDGEHLAVLCSGENGGSVHIFALTETEESGVFKADGTVFSDMCWLDDRICCVTDDKLYFCDADGRAKGEYSFEGKKLGSSTVLGSEIVVELRAHSFGGEGTLVAVNSDAKECGRAVPGAEIMGYDFADGRLLTLCQGKLLCYDESLKLLESKELRGCEYAFLRNDDLLLIAGSEAKITDFNAEE